MITKAQVIDSLQGLPNKMSVDQLIDKIIFVEKIQRGLADSKAGRVNSKEQAKKKLAKWLK